MEGIVHGLTAYAALRMILPDSLSGLSTVSGIMLASSPKLQAEFSNITLITHYYVVTSVMECLLHKYQMHGKLCGKWLNPNHINHHRNVAFDMTLKHAIEDDDNSGEFSWYHVVAHCVLLHLVTRNYMSRVFGVRPMTNALTWACISISSTLIWNSLHNSMHSDDHKHSLAYGPPRLFLTKDCDQVFGEFFKTLKRHHELHHIIKTRKTNFCVIFLGADKLFGWSPTKEELRTARGMPPL